MATIQSELTSVEFVASASGHRLGIARLAATGGIAAALFFILCWLGLFIPLASPSHAYIGLFTTAEPTSAAALLQGGLWSLAFGVLMGALVAGLYNLLSGLDRR